MDSRNPSSPSLSLAELEISDSSGSPVRALIQEGEEARLTSYGRAFANPAWTCDEGGNSLPQLRTVWEFTGLGFATFPV